MNELNPKFEIIYFFSNPKKGLLNPVLTKNRAINNFRTACRSNKKQTIDSFVECMESI